MSVQVHHHRATLKQKNKPFKSRFASKRSRNGKKKKGRSSIPCRSATGTVGLTKVERQGRALDLRRRHLHMMQCEGKIYKGMHGVPKVVSIIGLTPDYDPSSIFKKLCQAAGAEYNANILHPLIWDDKQNQKCRIIPVRRNPKDVADACLFSDIVLMALSAVEEVDKTGRLCLSLIKAIGSTIRAGVVQGMDQVKEKKRKEVLSSLRYYLSEHFGGVQEIFDCSDPSKFSKISRWIGAKLPQRSHIRDFRSYMVADSCKIIPNEIDPNKCTLVMSGHVQGSPMSPDNSIYIPDVGTFLIEKIEVHEVPNEHGKANVKTYTPSPLQSDLVPYIEPDPMDADQPWPTDDEIKKVQESTKKRIVRAPVGTSSYQAAWIVESDEEEDPRSDMLGGINPDQCNEKMDLDEVGEHLSDDSVSISSDNGSSDHDMSEGEDAMGDEQDWSNYLEVKAQREKEELEEREFPDEIELHPKIPARERLRRYRGLKNFKSSVWDKYEDLPIDYAKISHVKDTAKTYKAAVKNNLSSPIPIASLVSVFVRDVPIASANLLMIQNLHAYISLYKHEEKFTLVNFSLLKKNDYDGVVRSKDEVIIQYGFRRIIANPIYSTNTKNGTNNVHKFEKFLHNGRSAMACMYAPITFGSTPVIMYRADTASNSLDENSDIQIVATGILENMDTSRIVVKRVILTGHPFKIHKRTAVIRYMFFNPEDVNYFEPLELRTKLGRRGHILSSIGTHGRMKCSFDKPIKANDTVCIYLYKRVFPKWTTKYYITGNIIQGI